MTTEKTHRLLASLEQAVLDVQDSDTFKAYLRMAAKFHKYSFGNILLIASQRPDATRVAGFRTWHALGRHVRRGEKGIAIVVPFRSLRDNDEGEVEERVRFGTGYVFDISQTEGADLPEVEVPLTEGWTMERLTRAGDVVEGILAASEGRDADLIVMATEGHQGFLDALRGSTTERVLRGTKCAVLAVPPP